MPNKMYTFVYGCNLPCRQQCHKVWVHSPFVTQKRQHHHRNSAALKSRTMASLVVQVKNKTKTVCIFPGFIVLYSIEQCSLYNS